MPNLITHYYFSQIVKELLPQDIRETIEKQRQAFILGAIGPDFLFALRELGMKEKKFPNVMQYLKVFEVFESCGRYVKDNYDDITYSYLLGLLCHYVSDYHVHPFVNFFSERALVKQLPINQAIHIHALIESAIDSHICEEKLNTPCNEFPAHITCRAPRRVKRTIGRLYEKVIGKIFGYDTKARRYVFSFNCTELFMKFSIDKKGRKKKFFDWLENKFGLKKKITGLIRPPEGYGRIDYMNRQKRQWLTVRNGSVFSDESVDELLERAAKEAVKYIKNYNAYVFEGGELDKKDFSVNYEGIKIY
ncbi:MAG: zinc dependent phospholipase C family protein [Christensenellales bacterium]|jgi:hypothetical protein|nr:zinc dependent phospholipase C family protein [Clostridiales bacterium]